jgi:ketosteroid isomerase-like protein
VEPPGNTAIVRDLFDAFNNHDLDRVAAMVSEDFVLADFAAESQVFRGPPRHSPMASDLLDGITRRQDGVHQRSR